MYLALSAVRWRQVRWQRASSTGWSCRPTLDRCWSASPSHLWRPAGQGQAEAPKPPTSISSCCFGWFAPGTKFRLSCWLPSPPARCSDCHRDRMTLICCRCSWAVARWLRFCWLANWTKSCHLRWDYRHWWFCRSCRRWGCGCPADRVWRWLQPCGFRFSCAWSRWLCPRGRSMNTHGHCPRPGISCRCWPQGPTCRCWPCGRASRRFACLLRASICRSGRPCCRSPPRYGLPPENKERSSRQRCGSTAAAPATLPTPIRLPNFVAPGRVQPLWNLTT